MEGFVKTVAVFLGLSQKSKVKADHNSNVPVQLPLDRHAMGPILYPCDPHHGGVQGLKWYAGSLKTDKDGDVANEFLYEFTADTPGISQDREKPRFLQCHDLKPAEVKQQRMTQDGKLQCCVDRQGQLVWI
ncbi:hypothetical protein KSS87_017250 [Heliosperma pusillum]|nr:hypothetical protein KSS87_017250 [Heliosperma pusillum]